jgi:prophage regulatory protein
MSERDKILRMPDIVSLTGLSRTTIYRKIKEGTFPAQLHISDHCCGWRASAIELWIADSLSYRAEKLH